VTPQDIKGALNKPVRLRRNAEDDGEYILSGAIFRKSEKDGYYYQAELEDIKHGRHIIIARFEDVEII
jgi:hypothetical protein